ncbi:metallophosphoesterase [Gayadomonas joobiniege]|uniref:metallophosphoesterase family protein n=1 Tax=Gayadomonas joobiniege TaxID=1234606 RepID=UPI0004745992
MHPMSELLKQQSAMDVDMVIALGDLTDGGSEIEFNEWRSVAEQYADQGIEFLPVMGNHETSYAYTVNWINHMKHFIPEDAVHMPGYEWVNYYVIRENVLVIGLAYYNLPIAFEWIKTTIEDKADQVDHIVVASHDGLIGAKYGQTREQIVDGTKGDDWVYSVQPKIRELFADHDVIYVQGHEHQYQRSLISAKTALTTYPSSATPSGGNYRMDVYTQIMAGNASYKGYEFRYGERDLVQMIVSQKNQTDQSSDPGYDVNSSILTFNGTRVDYVSYFANHNAHSNDASESFDADWKLLDKFSRSTNRCESVFYANSILPDTRPVMVLQPEYVTNECYATDGTFARLAGGFNNTFNRTDSRTRDMSYTPGFTRAETMNDLVRLAYQWLFQYHENWTPNLNGPNRVIPDYDADEMIFPETTMDLKEHVTLSWLPASEQTVSDILIISGLQNQTGIYQDDYGVEKDITTSTGLAGSQTDGGAKSAVILPAYATQEWDIRNAPADPYAVEITLPENINAADVQLAIKTDNGWAALAEEACILNASWNSDFIENEPSRDSACADQALVGYDQQFGNRWWAVLKQDAELAFIQK